MNLQCFMNKETDVHIIQDLKTLSYGNYKLKWDDCWLWIYYKNWKIASTEYTSSYWWRVNYNSTKAIPNFIRNYVKYVLTFNHK